MNSAFFSNFIVWYVVLLFATTVHEAMHAYVSARGGDYTGHAQATLNPVPHIRRSFFGMVVAPVAMFFMSGGSYLLGWASTPFNPHWAARYPKRAFLMSMAGPLSHLPVLFLSLVAMIIGLRSGYFGPPGSYSGDAGMFPVTPGRPDNLCWVLAMFANVSMRLNSLLFFFNLIPLPPLDGSEVWFLFMKSEATRLRYRMLSASYSFAGLMLAWYVLNNYYPYVQYALLYLVYSFA